MKESPIKKIDQLIFGKIDLLKSNPNYEKFKDLLSQIDEEYKNPAQIIGTLAFFFVPVFILSIFWGINSSLKNEIQIKKEIIEHAGQILGNQEMITKTSKGVLANSAINNFNSFNTKVTSIATAAGLDLSKIQISDFQTEELSKTVMKSKAIVRVEDVTTSQIGSFMNGIIIREKMKISNLSFNRDSTKKLVTGTMTVIHFGKISSTPDAETEE